MVKPHAASCASRAPPRAPGARLRASHVPVGLCFRRSAPEARGGWGSARPRDLGTWSRATSALGAARRSDAVLPRPRVRETLPERYARLARTETPLRAVHYYPPPIHPIHEILALAVFRDVPPATCRRGEGLARFFFFSAVARVASARLASCPRFVSSSRRPRDRVGTDLAPSSSSSPRTAHPARRAPRRRARRSRRW